MMSDFHADSNPSDPGPIRLAEMDSYFEACRRHSDRDFLLLPGEEANAHLGGHYTLLFPKPVYWTKVRGEGQVFSEEHPQFGTVYHTGSAADMLEMMQRESGLAWQAHPRTKGSTYYPDVIRDTPHFQSDRYLGVAFKNFPVDMSERRLCPVRCFDTLDDMNNWAGPKYLVAEGDTYTKFPEDEIYGESSVNYIKVDSVPSFDSDWSPILDAMRAGDFFVTTGEVLITGHGVEGAGKQRTYVADIEWTFPLEFVEIVWATATAWTGRSFPPVTDRRFRANASRFPSMPRPSSGCASPHGTRPATEHSPSLYTCSENGAHFVAGAPIEGKLCLERVPSPYVFPGASRQAC